MTLGMELSGPGSQYPISLGNSQLRGIRFLQEDSRSLHRTVNLKNAALSAAALKAVLAFMYTERLDVAIEDVDAVLRVARKCRMHAVVKAIGDEMRTLKYYFKSTRRDEAPRRYVTPIQVHRATCDSLH